MNLAVSEFGQERLREEMIHGQKAFFDGQQLPRYVDCGDERPLTEFTQRGRAGEIPGRHFGAASGLAIVVLAGTIMEYVQGEAEAKALLGEHGSVEALAAVISDRAKSRLDVRVVQHSSDGAERRDDKMDCEIEGPVGCKFNEALGSVVSIGGSELIIPHIGQVAAFANDQRSTTQGALDAQEAFKPLLDIIGGREACVTRYGLTKVFNSTRYTPQAMVKGEHRPHDQANVVIDLAGYKAKANGTDYHHSTKLPHAILSHILPEYPLRASTFEMASLVTGLATQQALQVPRTLVIPESYAQAA